MPTWIYSTGDITGDVGAVVIGGNSDGAMIHCGTGDQIVHVHNDADTSASDDN